MVPPGYAVASAHPLATQAGLKILAQGGNAFDAAVAVSAALAVVEPYHSGLGGGGLWLLYEAKSKRSCLIDGREVAPLKAHAKMFLDKNKAVIPGLSINGVLSSAIPGEPAALVYLAKNYGRLSLSQCLQPAIELAEKGFPIDHHFYYFLQMKDRMEQLKSFSSSRKIFFKNGRSYEVGETFVQRDLAQTLKVLAEKGHDGFYKGEVAKRLVQAVQKAGGIWTLKDLSNYRIKKREPLQSQYHDMKIITAPLPSAGGIALVTMLNILEDFHLQKISQVQKIHYIVEAMRLAYWQRAEHLADSDFVEVPVHYLTSKNNAKELRQLIQPHQPTPSKTLKDKQVNDELKHTTHFSIIDGEGNRVSATLTINYIFGSSFVAEGTGVLLNDEMDDFSLKPSTQNLFGLIGGDKNLIEPGKRPLSSMTPTFLETGSRVGILGTPGGSRIPSMVLLSSMAFQKAYGAITMVSLMRFHHQYLPDALMFEPNTFSKAVQSKLKHMGYQLVPLEQNYGDMQAISWDKQLNVLTAASDPRNIGQATTVLTHKNHGYGVNY